jgi:hypothetical protein
MAVDDADDLVPFQDVRVIRSAAPALLCRIAQRNVWLPRGHIAGKLWCTGDRGKLFIRRWVARDRHLIDLHGWRSHRRSGPSHGRADRFACVWCAGIGTRILPTKGSGRMGFLHGLVRAPAPVRWRASVFAVGRRVGVACAGDRPAAQDEHV